MEFLMSHSMGMESSDKKEVAEVVELLEFGLVNTKRFISVGVKRTFGGRGVPSLFPGVRTMAFPIP